jgi:hypothetical protein
MNQDELRNKIIYRRLATPESLCQRPLDLSEIKKMDSLVYRYHELFNIDNLQAAIDKPAQIAAGREQLQKNRARDFWTATDDATRKRRAQTAMEVGEQFQQMFPQFLSCEENTTAIVNLIKERQETFNLESVIRAYQTLCAAGLILVTPENVGLSGSEAVKGKMLTSIPNWERVLEPVQVLTESEREQVRIANLTSDQYQAEFLQKDETPALILRRIESDIREFCKKHPEYDPTPEGKEILLSWIKEQGLHVCHDSLEAAWSANQEKLHAANCIFDSGPSIAVKYGASTLIDHRKPAIPSIERPVVIKEPETPKRWSRRDILDMTAQEYQDNLQRYGQAFEDAVNEM